MDEPTPAPRRPRRRAAVAAVVAALVVVPAIAIAGGGGGGGSAEFESLPALQEEQRPVKDHDGRDCPFKRDREQRSTGNGV
jgi:hypothetical protein